LSRLPWALTTRLNQKKQMIGTNLFLIFEVVIMIVIVFKDFDLKILI
jgi:hypothetical protein